MENTEELVFIFGDYYEVGNPSFEVFLKLGKAVSEFFFEVGSGIGASLNGPGGHKDTIGCHEGR